MLHAWLVASCHGKAQRSWPPCPTPSVGGKSNGIPLVRIKITEQVLRFAVHRRGVKRRGIDSVGVARPSQLLQAGQHPYECGQPTEGLAGRILQLFDAFRGLGDESARSRHAIGVWLK
jgi:hypothetical protein